MPNRTNSRSTDETKELLLARFDAEKLVRREDSRLRRSRIRVVRRKTIWPHPNQNSIDSRPSVGFLGVRGSTSIRRAVASPDYGDFCREKATHIPRAAPAQIPGIRNSRAVRGTRARGTKPATDNPELIDRHSVANLAAANSRNYERNALHSNAIAKSDPPFIPAQGRIR